MTYRMPQNFSLKVLTPSGQSESSHFQLSVERTKSRECQQEPACAFLIQQPYPAVSRSMAHLKPSPGTHVQCVLLPAFHLLIQSETYLCLKWGWAFQWNQAVLRSMKRRTEESLWDRGRVEHGRGGQNGGGQKVRTNASSGQSRDYLSHVFLRSESGVISDPELL